ncbi:SapC family protein [Marinimicrobium sp. C2-29]|uniref:SapC family protein n=1 Tax=Marinimicrobium sp. C2-29 TaxID=3139825 RepID=UPI0031389821
MSNIELLDNVKHKDLRVDPGYTAAYGDSVNQVLVFPSEFVELQKEYPILLKKDGDSGSFQAVVILGLERDENLFLDESGWHAHYVPAVQARGPFSIGLRKEGEGNEERVEPLIQVDMESPRVRPEGTPVFLQHGGSSEYLKRVSKVLKVIQEGWAVARTFYPTLDKMGLIEPVNININLSETERYSIENYYTVSEDKLLELDGDQLKKLNELGYLQAAYHLLASQTNISRLLARKNRKRDAA